MRPSDEQSRMPSVLSADLREPVVAVIEAEASRWYTVLRGQPSQRGSLA
jgi:hypothetical protein